MTKLLALFLLLLLSRPVLAQPFFFGSADAPDEYVAETWWQQRQALEARGGVSLIGPQWRGLVGLRAEYARPGFSARLGGNFHAGPLGLYDADVDEAYDALRLVRYARLDPGPEGVFYARVGPSRDLRLGNGHLVNFFSSETAWDERTTGAEGAVRLPRASLDVFTEDLRLNRLVGARLSVTPRLAPRRSVLSSLEIGASYVRDFNRSRGRLEAFGADVSLDLVAQSDFDVRPYVAAAHIRSYGEGLAVGVVLENLNFLDAARLHARAALTYSSEAFLPGYFGTFYSVQNPGARIVDSDRYLQEELRQDTVGVGLAGIRGGSGFVTEFRLLVFQRFQFWHSFYRHYGLQPLSSHHLRVYYQAPESLEFGLGIDREGLRSFLSLFNRINDQSALVLTGRYRLFGPVVVGLDARYTFERLSSRAGRERYLAQRRFEPYAAVRLVF